MFLSSCDDSGTIPIDEDPNGEGEITFEDPGKTASMCYPAFEDEELNVVTWNIENFPMTTTTLSKVETIISALDADVIAIQEIAEPSEFVELGKALPEWTAVYADVRHGQEIGYLYKTAAFTFFDELDMLFGDDSNAFPRQAVVAHATHVSGLEVTFMNIHLKCCGGSGSNEEQRRRSASEQMKAYIDEFLSERAVILLGDFNDEIIDGDTPFQNFLDDPSYRFTDQEIAVTGDESNWSYPSWPSHIDHILISDELFDKVSGVQVLTFPEECISNYSERVSDHRPVLASFK